MSKVYHTANSLFTRSIVVRESRSYFEITLKETTLIIRDELQIYFLINSEFFSLIAAALYICIIFALTVSEMQIFPNSI